MPLKYKREKFEVCALVDVPNLLLENELMVTMLKDRITRYPFVYGGKQWLLVEHLQEGGKKHVIPLILQLVLHFGIDRLQEMVLELKFEKKPEPSKEEE